jgi:hypothetical protein
VVINKGLPSIVRDSRVRITIIGNYIQVLSHVIIINIIGTEFPEVGRNRRRNSLSTQGINLQAQVPNIRVRGKSLKCQKMAWVISKSRLKFHCSVKGINRQFNLCPFRINLAPEYSPPFPV